MRGYGVQTQYRAGGRVITRSKFAISVVARILKHLAAMGTIYETGPDQYSPTPVSKALVKQVHRDTFLAW